MSRRGYGRLVRGSLLALWGGALLGCTGAEAEVTGRIHPPTPREPLVRPDTPGGNLQFSFDEGDVVETFASSDDRFLIHFTRDGEHAVPAGDVDASGVPDFVEEVAATYVEVLAHVEALGFFPPLDDGDIPDNGGDDRFDVYLVDFQGVGDGTYRSDACLPDNPDQCAGFMTQENDFVGYGYPSTLVANRILGSHEFFHAVQAGYDDGQGSVFNEGTAVWFTETFDPSLRDFEAFLPGYFENPDRPLDEPLPGPVDPFSYGSAIFFQFLAERYEGPIVQELFVDCRNGSGGVDDPYWLEQLDPLLAVQADTTFAEAFVEFATWNLATDDFDDPAGGYANGDAYPRIRIDPEPAPHQDEAIRAYRASSTYIGLTPGDRTEMTAALVGAPEDVADLVMLLAVEGEDAITSVETVPDPVAGLVTVDVSSARRLVVVVVNTAIDGDSRRPGLCIGSPAEVEACQLALGAETTGSGGGGGAGSTASSGSSTSGGAEGGAGPTTSASGAGGDAVAESEDEGCGCTLPGGGTSRSGGAAVALALLVAASRRRRSRS